MPDRPKLCYVIYEYSRDTDRHYFHLYEFLELLAKDVDLFVIALGGDRPDIPGVAHAEVLSRESQSPTAHRRYAHPGMGATFKALHRARKLGYRRVFVHYSFPVARRAALYGRLRGMQVYLWHSILVHKLIEDVDGNRLMSWLHHLTFRLVHGLVTSSTYMKSYYVKEFRLPEHKVKVVRSSISLERFDPDQYDRAAERARLGYGPDDKVVLYVHGLERGKGCLELPEITSLVRARVPESRFEIVGDGSRRDEIVAELERRQMTDRVTMRGRIPNTEIMKFYAAADIFIMPSRFEEFSRVLLEAMAMGVPFVSSDGSGPILSYVSPTQKDWVVPAMRTAEFAQRTVQLLQNDDARRHLSEHGREYVRRFALDRQRDEFMMEVLEANPPADG